MSQLWRINGLQLNTKSNGSQHAAVSTAGRISERDGQQSNGMNAASNGHGMIVVRTPGRRSARKSHGAVEVGIRADDAKYDCPPRAVNRCTSLGTQGDMIYTEIGRPCLLSDLGLDPRASPPQPGGFLCAFFIQETLSARPQFDPQYQYSYPQMSAVKEDPASMNQNDRPIRWSIVGVIAFISILGVLGPKLLWSLEAYRIAVRSWPVDVQFIIHPTIRMLLVVIGTCIVYRMRPSDQRLTMGLKIGSSRAFNAFALGFMCTLPMLLLGFVSRTSSPSHYEVLYTAITPGLTEEIFYRAFMFGLLVQAARCPMWPAAIITAVIFGLAHINITPDEGQTILGQLNAWNAMIALGGLMLAWIYYLSNWNLWIVIALHIGMNMWWDMFDLTDTPLGGFGATLARIIPIALAVMFVLQAKSRQRLLASTITA